MCVCVVVVQARSLEYNVCDRPTVTIEHNVRCCCFVIFFSLVHSIRLRAKKEIEYENRAE